MDEAAAAGLRIIASFVLTVFQACDQLPSLLSAATAMPQRLSRETERALIFFLRAGF